MIRTAAFTLVAILGLALVSVRRMNYLASRSCAYRCRPNDGCDHEDFVHTTQDGVVTCQICDDAHATP